MGHSPCEFMHDLQAYIASTDRGLSVYSW